MFRTRFAVLPILMLAASGSLASAAPLVRVKDLAAVEGVRSNPLVGYGLVVGLQGTGDGTQAAFTIQSLANLLRRSGVSVPQSAIRVRNVAAVMVTMDLPPFARPGQRQDVQVSSIGDAKSLQGGTLLVTPLVGPDGNTYAVAQGAVSIGGAFLGGGGGNSTQKNHPTTGRVPSGAVVERSVPTGFDSAQQFRLLLNSPDFATASRVARSINEALEFQAARAEDAVSIQVVFPPEMDYDPVSLLATVQALEVRPDTRAQVIINEKTGTVVMGQDVRISKVAVAHGNLSVEVRTVLEPSQPAPLSEKGETVVVPQREVFVNEGPNRILTLEEGLSVSDLVQALNALGVSARDMIAILQAMRTAGALHAEIVSL